MQEDEESKEIQSFNACERPDCSRIFSTSRGYTDRINGQFDDSRASARSCPACGAMLYLAEVDHNLKVENWECPDELCDYTEVTPSPASQ
jgi:hypothetical protein